MVLLPAPVRSVVNQRPGRIGKFIRDDGEFCRRAFEDESIQGPCEAFGVMPTVCRRPDECKPSPGEERQKEQSAQDCLPRCWRQEVALWYKPLLSPPEIRQQREHTNGGNDREGDTQQRNGSRPDPKPVADVSGSPRQHHEGKTRKKLRETEELLPTTIERDEANAPKALFNCHRTSPCIRCLHHRTFKRKA